MRLVDEAIEDRVGQSGVADGFVPVVEGELAGDEGSSSAMAILEDFEQVAALGVGEGSEAEVIEEEEFGAGEPIKETRVGAIATSDGQVSEEAGETEVASGEALPTGAVSESTGEKAFTGAGGAGDEHDLVSADPVAASQAEQEGLVQAARRAEVDVLDGSREAQLGELQVTGEAPVVTAGEFSFDEQGEAVVEAEGVSVGDGELLFERGGHADEAQFVESFQGLLDEHQDSPEVEVA